MQVAASPYPASQPLYPYPNHYHHHHHPIPVAHDHELKRQYLGLLPPQQVIEICITFDVHVPPYVKASVWPIDLSAAIAGLQKQAADAAAASAEAEGSSSSASTASSSTASKPRNVDSGQQNGSNEEAEKSSAEEEEEDGGEGAIMDSLKADSPARPSPAPEGESSKDGIEEPRPPDKESTATEEEKSKETTTDVSVASDASSTADGPDTTDNDAISISSASSTSSASTSTPTSAQTSNANAEPALSISTQQPPQPPAAASSAVPPPMPPHPGQPPMPVAYPHQPYGYPYAPYYPPPPPGYPYPHHQYPAYPHQHQHAHAYPPAPPPAALPPVPPPPAPPMPMMQQDGPSPDDLPSYEEMIVEALMDTNDPEGCAPKDLFTWMAARYPVQSNFRPSASQALQKAYKRGRLEKSSNNKYRINAAWEGGNTSRRTTRRPQTHTHTMTSTNNAPTTSPFTNTPLVHHHHQQQQQPQQHQPFGYSSYPYPPSAYNYNNSQTAATAAAGTAPQAQQAATATAPTTAIGTSISAATPSTVPTGLSSEATKALEAQNKEVSDAYEAAQNILKAINFGSLLQLPAEETQEGVAAKRAGDGQQTGSSQHPAIPGVPGFPSGPAASSHLQQAQNPHHQPQTLLAALNGAQQQHIQNAAAAATAQAPGAAENAIAAGVAVGGRADLQAQLALLAAQLAELARVEEPSASQAPHVEGHLHPQHQASPVVRPQGQPAQPVRGLFFHPSAATANQQQPVQTQPQAPPYAQPQAYPPPQNFHVQQAPMSSLMPPAPAEAPISQLPDSQVQQQQTNTQPAPAVVHANGTNGQQAHVGWDTPMQNATTSVGGQQQSQHGAIQPQGQNPVSPELAPMEPMDDSLDGEYDSEEDDDDMEEVI